MVGMVFDRYPAGGGELNLALAIADHAHDDGTHVFAYVSTLAEKSRQSVRTVQYQLDKMLRRGWLLRVGEGHGGRGKPAQYRINPAWIKGGELADLSTEKGAEIAPFSEVPADASKGAEAIAPFAQERVQSTTEKGATAVAPAIEPYEPNTVIHPPTPQGVNPAVDNLAAEGGSTSAEHALLTLDEWLAHCAARGEQPLPPMHEVFEWALDAGIGLRWLTVAFAEWCAQRRKSPKRSRCFPDDFERALRRSALHLWVPAREGQGLVLTAAGKQAFRVHQDVADLRSARFSPRPLPGVTSAEVVAQRLERDRDPELARMVREAAAHRDPEAKARSDAARKAAMEALGRGKSTGQEVRSC